MNESEGAAMNTALVVAALALPSTVTYSVCRLIERAMLRRLDEAVRGGAR